MHSLRLVVKYASACGRTEVNACKRIDWKDYLWQRKFRYVLKGLGCMALGDGQSCECAWKMTGWQIFGKRDKPNRVRNVENWDERE
ncbi:hypothetical protein WN48_04617 [Eufriesea mexicana]|uniref:Uncharacterized protein n=1 Tax=Eufriesea mexicana TaxID=516756 RepID=A0A310SBX1_9HYME|nr:hypothetical protein WN48_04617 [Eufriesea mexicana]